VKSEVPKYDEEGLSGQAQSKGQESTEGRRTRIGKRDQVPGAQSERHTLSAMRKALSWVAIISGSTARPHRICEHALRESRNGGEGGGLERRPRVPCM